MKTMNDARCLARIIRPGLCRGVSVRACLALLACALAFAPSARAQAASPEAGGASPAKPAAAAGAPPAKAATAAGAASPQASEEGGFPRSFRGIELGMAKEEVDALLSADSFFSYRGPDDVSLLPSPNQSLIETAGDSFVKRAFFQFYEGKLWVMILVMDQRKMDHYSVYSSLRAKYGEPTLLDPREVRWEDEATRVALERPLTLRYLDLATYRSLREGSEAREAVEELERREFLGDL